MLFPPTREVTFFVPGRALWQGAGGIAGGAVATRAGGLRALVLYVGFQLATIATMLPGVVYSCARSGPIERGPCDYASLVLGQWPLWLAIAVGALAARALAARALAARGNGSNDVLRAAGALAAAIAIALAMGSLLLFLVVLPNSPNVQLLGLFGLSDISIYFFAAGNLIGGVLAGLRLVRRGIAAPLLLALCLVAPSFANGVPLWRTETGLPPYEPLQVLLARFSWFWIPSLGALALFIVWAVARRRGGNLLLTRSPRPRRP